eukprot:scaffold10562_cov63-Phaeocystis_antarctica.AAC.3
MRPCHDNQTPIYAHTQTRSMQVSMRVLGAALLRLEHGPNKRCRAPERQTLLPEEEAGAFPLPRQLDADLSRLLVLAHSGHRSHRLVEEARQDDHDEDHSRLDEQPRLAQRHGPAAQHAVVLDDFDAEPEREDQCQGREVGEEDQEPAETAGLARLPPAGVAPAEDPLAKQREGRGHEGGEGAGRKDHGGSQHGLKVGEAPREEREEAQLEHESVEDDLDELRLAQLALPLLHLGVVGIGRPEGRDQQVLVLDRRPHRGGWRRRGRHEDLLDLDRVGHRAPRRLQLGQRREAALATLGTALGSRVERRARVVFAFLPLEEAATDARCAGTPGRGASAQRVCVCAVLIFSAGSHAHARSHRHAERRGGGRSCIVRHRGRRWEHDTLLSGAATTTTVSITRRGASLLRYIVAISPGRWRAVRAHGRGRSGGDAIGSLHAVSRCEPAGRCHRTRLCWDVGSVGTGVAAGPRSAHLAHPGAMEAGGGRHCPLHVVVAHLVARQAAACPQVQLRGRDRGTQARTVVGCPGARATPRRTEVGWCPARAVVARDGCAVPVGALAEPPHPPGRSLRALPRDGRESGGASRRLAGAGRELAGAESAARATWSEPTRRRWRRSPSGRRCVRRFRRRRRAGRLGWIRGLLPRCGVVGVQGVPAVEDVGAGRGGVECQWTARLWAQLRRVDGRGAGWRLLRRLAWHRVAARPLWAVAAPVRVHFPFRCWRHLVDVQRPGRSQHRQRRGSAANTGGGAGRRRSSASARWRCAGMTHHRRRTAAARRRYASRRRRVSGTCTWI